MFACQAVKAVHKNKFINIYEYISLFIFKSSLYNLNKFHKFFLWKLLSIITIITKRKSSKNAENTLLKRMKSRAEVDWDVLKKSEREERERQTTSPSSNSGQKATINAKYNKENRGRI